MRWVNDAKRRAAQAAAFHVESGTVIGLGSGTTAVHYIGIVGARLRSGELHDVLGIPTGHQSTADAVEAGIPLTTLDEHPEIDLTVDGADQIDSGLNVIKGGGAALLREKIVASASKRYIIIADERKVSGRLGDGCSLPVEVLPFSRAVTMRRIGDLGASPVVRLGSGKMGPVITDNGNFIIDADFGAMNDLAKLDRDLGGIPGVLETGLFLGYADIAYIGTEDSVREIRRR